jgi:hypothetical protein
MREIKVIAPSLWVDFPAGEKPALNLDKLNRRKVLAPVAKA